MVNSGSSALYLAVELLGLEPGDEIVTSAVTFSTDVAPIVRAGLVRRLGKFPFWRGEKPLVDAVEPAYLQASALGLEVFLGEPNESES